MQSFGVSWNNQQFNQGSPKPDGTTPANTTPVTGVYNASTGAFTLQWSSQVVGGPFNGFSAFWNLTGRFVPAAGSSAPAASSAGAPAAGSAATTPGTHAASGSTASGSTAGGSAASTPSSTGASASPSASGSSTTTTAPGASGATSPTAQTIEISRTASSGGGGWQAPDWLVALVAVLAVAGLAGVLLSERALRRGRSTASAE
jgi:cobalamin biosynthesis Mg chelatase CobN